jgi:tRNA splicing endonuclease
VSDENGFSMLDSRGGASSTSFSFGTFLAEREGVAQPIPHSEKVQNVRESDSTICLLLDFSRREKERLNHQRSKRG